MGFEPLESKHYQSILNGTSSKMESAGDYYSNIRHGFSSMEANGISLFSRLGRGAGWGAGIGIGLSAAGWLGSKMSGGDISSGGIMSSAFKGAAIGLTATTAYSGMQAWNNYSRLTSSETRLASFGSRMGGKWSAVGLGVGAAALGIKSIINTSLTRSSN